MRWVGERPRRTYLDFARRGEEGLTVTVSKRCFSEAIRPRFSSQAVGIAQAEVCRSPIS